MLTVASRRSSAAAIRAALRAVSAWSVVLHVGDDPGEAGGVLDEVGAAVAEHGLLVGAQAPDPDHQDQAEEQREDGDARGGERDDSHGRVEVPHGLQVRYRRRAVRR